MKTVLAAVLALIAPGADAQPAVDAASGQYVSKQVVTGPGCHFFYPVAAERLPRPVILWGNATNTMVVRYAPMLKHWSSQGIIVAASVSGNAGSGREMLACLDFLERESRRDGSVFYGAVDLSHVGAAGHSQGATGAIMAGRDVRVTATAAIQPATRGERYERGAERKQHGPMLLLSGGVDTITAPEIHHKPVFENAGVPIMWATLLAGGHNTPAVQDGGPYGVVTTAWFRWRLLGDSKAATLFSGPDCDLCESPSWRVETRGLDQRGMSIDTAQ